MMLPGNIDRYQIISECGIGGMAIVYRVFDPQRQQQVALKVMLPEYINDPELRERFKREIDIHTSFKHVAIVPIYGYGQYQGQPYLVMRYMVGGSLADKLAGGRSLALPEVVGLLKRITPPLDAAHQRGIIHRDMKPSNILYDDKQQAYISDFGIARLEEQPNITTFYGSSMIGSPAYMSPEQAQAGSHLDGRCDLYSLGVMVYEMLTGELPYNNKTPYKLAFDHATKPIPNILAANPKLPPECKSYIIKALAKKPEERFTSGHEMTEVLDLIIQKSKLLKEDHGADLSGGNLFPAGAPFPAKPLAKPVPQPPNKLQLDDMSQKARSSARHVSLSTLVPEFFRKIFGYKITLSMRQLPAINYFNMPSFLRPLTRWLGLPDSIAISRNSMIALGIILLILLALMALIIGLAAAYIIFRLNTAGTLSNRWLFIFSYQPTYR